MSFSRLVDGMLLMVVKVKYESIHFPDKETSLTEKKFFITWEHTVLPLHYSENWKKTNLLP